MVIKAIIIPKKKSLLSKLRILICHLIAQML